MLLADDYLALRVPVEQAPDVEMVGEAEDSEEACADRGSAAGRGRAGLPLAATGGGRGSGRGAAGPTTRVLAPSTTLRADLSAYDDERYVRGMLEAGAVGYRLKEEAPEAIVAAVRAAARGEGYFSPSVAARVAAWARGERPGGLTERELEVLRLVAEGLSNKEIAKTLNVTVRTVEFHVSNILKKLGVTSRVEAAVWAKEHGIVP